MIGNDGYEYIEDGPQVLDEDANPDQQVNAVPVHVTATDSERVAPQFANLNTFTIAQLGASQGSQPTYTPILQKRQGRYKAKFSVALGTATAIWLNTDPSKLMGGSSPTGFLVTTSGNSIPDYDSERELYAVAVGGANATISVMDESYGQQQ
jgi:hypothetical protein